MLTSWIKFHTMLHLFHSWSRKSYFHYHMGSFIWAASLLAWHFHHKLHAWHSLSTAFLPESTRWLN